jgi:hypothetical protein
LSWREEGLNAVLFGQGFASMNAPSKELERLALDRRIDHGPPLVTPSDPDADRWDKNTEKRDRTE